MLKSLMCFTFLNAFSSSAQVKIYFEQDTSNFQKDGIGFVIQNKQWKKFKLTDTVEVVKGELFDVEFSIDNIQYNGIKKLKVYNDTIISIKDISLENIIVTGKKEIIKQSLRGFEYYPKSDSVFLNQPILYALQRLPFVSIVDDQIRYKNESKIWYRINGKDRRALENSWNAILLAIKTSTILKVELITDLPLYIKNQNFEVIINIVTNENNLKGIILNTSAILDSRENLNKNFSITVVRKKNDFAFSYNNNEDQFTNQKVSKTLEGEEIRAHHKLEDKFQTDNHILNLKMGRRIDTLHDLAFSIRYRNFQNSHIWNNTYNFPSPLNNFKNKNQKKEISVNLSYVFAKSKAIENSILLGYRNGREEFNNHTIQYATNQDSINRTTQSFDKVVILEYNHRNVAKPKFRYEYGMQLYGTQLSQNYYLFACDSNETKQLLEQKIDTLMINQFGARPYLRFNRFSKKNTMYVLELDIEFLTIYGDNVKELSMMLPSFLIEKKTLINKSNSLNITGELIFLKPGDNFFKLIQSNVDPIESRIGNVSLVPSKNMELYLEWVKTGKHTYSNQFGILYEFDILNFFTQYDLSSNQLKSYSNNDARKFAVYLKPTFDYSREKLSFSLGSELMWIYAENNIDRQSFDGFVVNGHLNANYRLPKSIGTIGFSGIFNSNHVTYQGTATGLNKYALYYSKRFLKNKIITTFTAENFMLKEREWIYRNQHENFTTTNYITKPFRLFNVRIAYNFSTLKGNKLSKLKTTEVSNVDSE